jgi:hypothetical protein
MPRRLAISIPEAARPLRESDMDSERTIQEILDELLAAGLVEIKGTRNGRPVYVATKKLLTDQARISEPPSSTQ